MTMTESDFVEVQSENLSKIDAFKMTAYFASNFTFPEIKGVKFARSERVDDLILGFVQEDAIAFLAWLHQPCKNLSKTSIKCYGKHSYEAAHCNVFDDSLIELILRASKLRKTKAMNGEDAGMSSIEIIEENKSKYNLMLLIQQQNSQYITQLNKVGAKYMTQDEENELASDTCVLLNSGEVTSKTDSSIDQKEPLWVTAMQMFIPFLLAGFGMVAASLLLDKVQHWPVYRNVSEVYILVPALLGLKGNLEMTLASRLSTHANLGHLDVYKQKISLIIGNLALILCQALVVGFLASVAAIIFGWVPTGEINLEHALLLCASSIVTAFGASFILGLVMVGVILISRYLNINPDNVATPIAASLGDLTTLACLSWLASIFYHTMDVHPYLTSSSIVLGLLLVPVWGWIASRNEHTCKVLFSGWSPVITAMIISSIGGLILDFTVSQFKGVAVFQLVINGVGGNLVAVQASRISTELHSIAQPGQLPRNMQICINPFTAFCNKKQSSHAGTAQMLMLMVVPGHLIFAYTISYLQAGHTSFTLIFMVVYLSAALLQVFLLLYIAQIMTLNMWKLGIDPDNSAIPYLTAIGDLLGTLLLALAFHLLYFIGDRDSDVGD